MRKIIASMNITLDGYSNHTAMVITNELMEHYNEQTRHTGAILWGRITYQLMEDYWPGIVKTPSDNIPQNEYAVLIDNTEKVVFSKTLKSVHWKNARLAQLPLKEEVLNLKQQPGNDVFVGSPGLIAQLAQLNLIDEYRLCVHPVVLGQGLALFKNITNSFNLKLVKTKTFQSGVVLLCYERVGGDK